MRRLTPTLPVLLLASACASSPASRDVRDEGPQCLTGIPTYTVRNYTQVTLEILEVHGRGGGPGLVLATAPPGITSVQTRNNKAYSYTVRPQRGGADMVALMRQGYLNTEFECK